jgi:hypothetical protein
MKETVNTNPSLRGKPEVIRKDSERRIGYAELALCAAVASLTLAMTKKQINN